MGPNCYIAAQNQHVGSKHVSSKQLGAVQEAPAMTEDMLLEQQAALAALGKPPPPPPPLFPPPPLGSPHYSSDARPLWSIVCLSDIRFAVCSCSCTAGGLAEAWHSGISA